MQMSGTSCMLGPMTNVERIAGSAVGIYECGTRNLWLHLYDTGVVLISDYADFVRFYSYERPGHHLHA